MNILKRMLCGFMIAVFLSASFCCLTMVMAEDQIALSESSRSNTSTSDSRSCCPSTPQKDHKKCGCHEVLPVMQPDTVKTQGEDGLDKAKYFSINFVGEPVDSFNLSSSPPFENLLTHVAIHKPGPIFLVNRVFRL